MTHIKATKIDLKGEIVKAQYGNGTLALQLVVPEGVEPEERITLSVNLVESDGLVPPPGCVYVKAYSGHEGMPQALVVAGVAEYVGHGPEDRLVGEPVTIGRFDATVVLMRVLV